MSEGSGGRERWRAAGQPAKPIPLLFVSTAVGRGNVERGEGEGGGEMAIVAKGCVGWEGKRALKGRGGLSLPQHHTTKCRGGHCASAAVCVCVERELYKCVVGRERR